MTMTTAPSGTVTFLFTDVEGSTRRWEAHPVAMRDALALHDALLREAIQSSGGYVFKAIGDAFCAAFSSPRAALSAALAGQRALLAHRWDAVEGMRVRMSLHTGAADERDDDYFGPTVNRVARLLSTAHGGQVLLSSATEALLRDDLPEAVTLIDLGEHRLRDLSGSEHVFQLRHPDLPADFAPIRSLADFPNNLPVQLSSFVGREAELARVNALLETSRMLTITGMGGTGKTRLMLQVAARLLERFQDGVWLVALAPIGDPALVPRAVATTLGLKEEPGRRIEDTLADHLAGRRALLMLDNCEHLVEACANLAGQLLRAGSDLKILASSREGLGIAGETIWPLPPLALPAAASASGLDAVALERLAGNESLRLFVDRASAVKPGFALTLDNAPAVLEICRRLDGIALAIELAATRVRVMTVEQIATRLAQRFRLLTGGSRTALPHQQTLAAALDWSHDLLDPREQRLFRRLSVFSGGWTVEAVEAICADGEGADSPEAIESWDLLDLLGQLIDKSLVSIDEAAGMRQYLLETVREYARERLASSAELPGLSERHAAHYLALAEEAADELFGPRSQDWLERLDRERANLRQAIGWAVDAGDAMLGLRLGAALWRYRYMRGSFAEGREDLERALAIPAEGDPGAVRAGALHGLGTLATYQGDFDQARVWLEAALAIWRAIGDDAGAARSAHNLAVIAHEQGDYASARPLLEEHLAFVLESGSPTEVARAHSNLAGVALELGDLAMAEARFRAALAINRQIAFEGGIADDLRGLGATAMDRGDFAASRQLVEEGLALARQIDYKQAVAESLRLLGEISHRSGDFETARLRYDECLALEREMGNRRSVAWILGSLGRLAMDRGDDRSAAEALDQALAMLEGLGHKLSLASTLDAQGQLALRAGDLPTARQRLLRGLRLRGEMGSPLHLVGSYESLVGLALAEGHPDRALCLAAAACAIREGLGAPL
ncbi:MAG: tetratricopeptide repeat protein, partial [Chloroflexi bacterium]|nr:tetratricopeptide repeat protein [Chloroflexota bacterium]